MKKVLLCIFTLLFCFASIAYAEKCTCKSATYLYKMTAYMPDGTIKVYEDVCRIQGEGDRQSFCTGGKWRYLYGIPFELEEVIK